MGAGPARVLEMPKKGPERVQMGGQSLVLRPKKRPGSGEGPPRVREDEILHVDDVEQLELLRPAIEAVEEDHAYDHADNTKEAYRHEWVRFESWCASKRLIALPATPPMLVLYLAEKASQGRRPKGLSVAVAAIRWKHLDEKGGNLEISPTDHPMVRKELKRIRRRYGTRSVQKTPVTVDDLRQMVELIPETLVGRRNRAILLLGFSGAFRRSELAAMRFEDVTYVPEGMTVLIPRAKNDQEGEGFVKPIPFGNGPTCPVRALKDWMAASGIRAGILFTNVDRWNNQHVPKSGMMSGESITAIVKKYIRAIGLDAKMYAGHSLRSGMITAAAEAGRSTEEIMETSGHKDPKSVSGYIRSAKRFKRAASRGLL
jgi:integrase